VDALQADITAMTNQAHREARRNPQARLLMTIPVIGALTTLLFLAETGDIRRFRNARCLVSYAGLAPKVRASGDRIHLGRISKQGSPWLRWLFIEAATRSGRLPGRLGEFYRKIQWRHGKQAASVAPARKLTVIAYSALKTGRPYDVELG